MKVFLTGANGFLGYYLIKGMLNQGWEVIATGRGDNRLPFIHQNGYHYEEMDLTDKPRIAELLSKHRPAHIIHAGAMTRPDECELNKERAFETNVIATQSLLQSTQETGTGFYFISTDFVFDGERGMYDENDTPSPINYYGFTKLEAEQAVMNSSNPWTIVRTVSLYGKPFLPRPYLLNIVKQKLEQGLPYQVVDDQFRTPTYIEDLAGGIIKLVSKKATGIYHLSGPELMTPYEMAVRAAIYLGLDDSLIKKVNGDQFIEPAKRPKRTGFNITKAKNELGFDPVNFEEGLKLTFDARQPK